MTANEAVAATRRYPRRRDARAAIVAAARRLVEQKGEHFTTQELIKEAGVALQTLYRHFPGKDQLLVAVISDIVAEGARRFAERAAELADPVERLRKHVTTALEDLRTDAQPGPRFITSEHLRLHALFPAEMDEATRPFADLVEGELRAANAAGTLHSPDPARDAWLITMLVMSVYHHYSFLLDDPRLDTVAEDVWLFCLAAVGGEQHEPKRRARLRRLR